MTAAVLAARGDLDLDAPLSRFFPTLPERRLGVVVLQNEGRDGSSLADVIATYIYDRLLEKPDVAARMRRRLHELRERVTQARQARAESEKRFRI